MRLLCSIGMHKWQVVSAQVVSFDYTIVDKHCRRCPKKNSELTNDTRTWILAKTIEISRKDQRCLEYSIPSPRVTFLKRT
jgi:hypothetical protein